MSSALVCSDSHGTRGSASPISREDTPHSHHYAVRLDQFDCRDLVKRLDLVGRVAENRVFGLMLNIQYP